MSDFIFLDFAWKCLMTLTVSSSIVFVIALLGQIFIKKFVSSEKSKWFFNYHVLFIACVFLGGSMILTCIDLELITGCFNYFAINSNSYPITRLLAGGYLILLVLILAVDCIRIFITAKRHRAFKIVENHLINAELRDLERHLKIKNSTEVLLNEGATSPYVWGLFQHRIVVNPFLLSDEGKTHIRAILSHELMHIKGHDTTWLLLSHFVKRIFFFNPIAHLFYTKHRMAVELAADEGAIEQCGLKPQNLLRSIFEIAERCTQSQDRLLQAHASQEFSEIKERIHAMLGKPRRRMAWAYPAFSMISLALSLILVTLQTKASVSTQRSAPDSEKFMCSQIRHEMVIESWLGVEPKPKPNKCETK